MSKNFRIKDHALAFDGEKPSAVQKALDLSIEKWQYIVDHVAEIAFDGSADTCGLCMYHVICEDCVIKMDTGQAQCRGTPYYDFWHTRFQPQDNELGLEYAKAMLNYLIALKEKIGETQ